MNDTEAMQLPQKRSTFKAILSVFFSVLLVILLATSVTQTATPHISLESTIPLSDIASSPNEKAVDVTYDEASETLTLYGNTDGVDGTIGIPSPIAFNILFVHTDSDDLIRATYVRTESPNEIYHATGSKLDDGRHAFFFLGAADNTIRLKVPAASTIRISKIETMQIDDYTISYTPNLVSVIAYAAITLLLVLVEKKLGYYAWVYSGIKKLLSTAKRVRHEHGNLLFALHLLSRLATVGLILLAIADIAFNIISPAYSFALTVVASLTVLSILIDTCYVRKCATPEVLVLQITLIVGALIALTEPIAMQTSWDDGFHLANSAYIPKLLTNGGEISLSLHQCTEDRFNLTLFKSDPDFYMGTLLYFDSFDTSIIDLDAIFQSFSGLDWYVYPLALIAAPFVLIYLILTYATYIPNIILLSIVGATGADLAKMLVIGRLCNVILYSLMVHFAVKKLKSGKYLFSAIALLPICSFLSANYSEDWLINGMFLLGSAYFISILQNRDQKVSRRDLIIMISAFLLACGAKEIYFLMMLPLLFIPTNRFETKRSAKRTRLLIIVLMVLILLSFMVPMLIDSTSQTDIRGGEDVSASGQIEFILSNPLQYAKILLNFMKEYISLFSMSANLTQFAWLGFGGHFYSLLSILLLFFCVFTDRSEHDRFPHVGKLSLLTLGTTVIQIVLVATALYVSYTPVGFDWINGCQYRYLIPLFPLMLYFFAPLGGECKIKPQVRCALVFGLSALVTIATYYGLYIQPNMML